MNIDQLSDEQVDQLYSVLNGRSIDELSESEVDQVYSLVQSAPQGEEEEGGGILDAATSVGMGALKGLGGAMDYAGGLVRTANSAIHTGLNPIKNPIYEAVGLDYQSPDTYQSGDWAKAFLGQARLNADMMKDAGVEEGGSLSEVVPGLFSESGDGPLTFQKGGPMDITERGFKGFGADAAMDPLTYGTLGAWPIIKHLTANSPRVVKLAAEGIEQGSKAPSRATKAAGKELYRSGFKGVDRRLADRGQEGIADYAFDQGFIGGRKGLVKHIEKRKEALQAQRKELYKKAQELGVRVDAEESLAPAESLVEKLKHTGFETDALSKRIDRYRDPELIKSKGYQDELAKYQDELAQYKQRYRTYLKDQKRFDSLGGEQLPWTLADGQRTVQQSVDVPLGARQTKKGKIKRVVPEKGQHGLFPDNFDDLQKTRTVGRRVELHGPDASVMTPEQGFLGPEAWAIKNPDVPYPGNPTDDFVQYDLFKVPKKNLSIKGGQRSRKVNQDPGIIEHEMNRQIPIWDESQMQIGGLDIVKPRTGRGKVLTPVQKKSGQYKLPMTTGQKTVTETVQVPVGAHKTTPAEVFGVGDANIGQLEMPLAPSKPTRPVAPKKGFDIQQASDIKSALYDQLPASAFDKFGRLTSHGKQLLEKLSQGFKGAIESGANAKQAGLGDEISKVNREWGTYLNATKPSQKELSKETNKNLITQVKGAMTALNPWATAGMYGAQAVNSPLFRTAAGKTVFKIADQPFYDDLVRRSYIQLERGEE